MAAAAVALLLLGLAVAEAHTYTLDLDQPQKVRCAAPQQLDRQPRLHSTLLPTCKTSPDSLRSIIWKSNQALLRCAG